MSKINIKILWPYLITAFLIVILTGQVSAQRRKRPSNMRHSEQEIVNKRKMDPVTCTYIKNGSTFSGNAYSTGETGRIKIGTSTLTFSNGHYTLKFDAAKFETRDVLAPQDKWKFNPWREEKIMNDFVQKGKFSTYKKGDQIYLRLYVDDTEEYLTDISLSGLNAKSFKIDEDGLLFEYNLK